MASSASRDFPVPAVKVKICGLTRPEDARAAAQAGADAIGINFVRESPRWIQDLSRARTVARAARGSGCTVCAGVFANSTTDEVLRAVEEAGLRIVQLHGDETPEIAAQLKARVGPRIAVWKAVRIATAADLAALSGYPCDAWLLDAKCAGVRGGSGRTFDWDLLKGVQRVKPLVLAGGLNPDNVQEAVRRVRPEWVDAASGVESAPGVKDALLVARFIRASRTA